jgi:hypothetical protein
MKKNYLNLMWLAVAAIFFVSCSDDNDPVVPKLSITADVLEISETATSALVVKVNADAVLETAYTVGLTLSGTAVEGVNFQEIAKTVTIPANASSATIFVTPINVSAIEDSKTVSIELKAGSAYELTATTSVAITIIDNANPPSDAPTVSFATSNIVTNPYLEEEFTIAVGLSKTFTSALTIPLTVSDALIAGTDYELVGLDNNAITIAAGEVSASFSVKMKNTAVVDMDKTLEFGFAVPSVTDYAVKATENTVSVNAVDPQVDFSMWFNEANEMTTFYAGGAEWPGTTTPYKTDLLAYKVRSFHWNTVEEKYSSINTLNYFIASDADSNEWEQVVNTYKKELGYKGIDIVEQERYELQAADLFGLTKFFAYEATYGSTKIKSDVEDWLHFATTDAAATEGAVVIPAQTLTLYKADTGYTAWKLKTTVPVGTSTESYDAWYADSRTTQGDLSQSTMVTPVSIQVAKSVGTYNLTTGMVDVDLTFTCNDTDFSIDPKYYIAKDGDTYTMRLQYTFYTAQ